MCDSAAEHVSSVTFAIKDKMNLCIGIAISSSLQIGLLVTPVLVLTGWVIGQPMSLFFENFETVVLFTSVLIVNYLIQDGRSNWLEGALLLVSILQIHAHRYTKYVLLVLLCHYWFSILFPPLNVNPQVESSFISMNKPFIL